MILGKKNYLASIAAGIAFCLHIFNAGSAAAGVPKAEFEQTSFTFKEVLEGEIVKHAYTIRNTGDMPLVIKSVRTSCGCTTAKKPDEIAPGKSDQILVEGNTNGYGGHRFEKVILVITNDPKQNEIRLTFEGPVARFAEIEPSMINLHGSVGEELRKEFKIIPKSEYPFTVLSAEPDNHLKGKIELKVAKTKNGYTVSVQNKVAQATRYRGKIIIKTDSPKKPELNLFVYCSIKKQSS